MLTGARMEAETLIVEIMTTTTSEAAEAEAAPTFDFFEAEFHDAILGSTYYETSSSTRSLISFPIKSASAISVKNVGEN